MTEVFSQMFWPLMACFVLVGIHAYLGIHVLGRKVIFVDLALAQIAALGAVYGVFIGYSFETDTLAIKGVSVAFTLIGALIFSFTRTPDERVPHEAIIGIIYAAALSLTVVVTANLPHGAEEVQQMLAGNILWVTRNEVLYTALLYAAVGVVHIIFYRQFFLLSRELESKNAPNLNTKLWDFLFYATFGIVVTSSVGMGGVLLVFGYLVIPSVIGVMLAHSTRMRLIIGWGVGALMSVVGVIVSYYMDLPSGPTIVVLLSLLLLFLALGREVAHVATRRRGLLHVALILAIGFIALFIPVYQYLGISNDKPSRLHLFSHGGSEEDAVRAALSSTDDDDVMAALASVKSYWLVKLLPDVTPFLTSTDDKKRELAASVIASLGDKSAIPALSSAIHKEQDVYIKIEMAEALLTLGDKQGLMVLAAILESTSAEFARDDAKLHLSERLIGAPLSNKELIPWLKTNFARIRFDESKKKYYLPTP